jgi:hypothetical protein
MPEESRRTFLLRYAALALAAMAPNGASAGDDGGAAKQIGDPGSLTRDVYGPPPSPYPTVDPQRPPPPAPVYGPPPRNPLD